MEKIREKWEKLSIKGQKIVQIVIGIILASLTGFFLTRTQKTESFLDFNIIIAALIALLGPNILETQLATKLPLMRRVLLICLAVFVVIIAIWALSKSNLI